MYIRQEFNNKYYYSYVVRENEKDNYKVKMITCNNIPGALQVIHKNVDGDNYLCYDVSSKYPFSERMKYNKIGYEEIKKLILSICDLADGMEEYLINYNYICLDENCIYLEEKKDRYEFIINPYEEANIYTGIKNLIKKILPIINHDDKQTVMITYGLMDVLDMVNVTVKDIEYHIGKIQESSIKEEMDNLGELGEIEGKKIANREYDPNFELDMVCEDYDDIVSPKKGIKEVVIDRLGGLIKREKQIRESKYKERPKLVIERKEEDI